MRMTQLKAVDCNACATNRRRFQRRVLDEGPQAALQSQRRQCAPTVLANIEGSRKQNDAQRSQRRDLANPSAYSQAAASSEFQITCKNMWSNCQASPLSKVHCRPAPVESAAVLCRIRNVVSEACRVIPLLDHPHPCASCHPAPHLPLNLLSPTALQRYI